MNTITWNTDVNAPCCPGEILADDGRSVLVQTDWDYPGVASSFGWSVRSVQRCTNCGGTFDPGDDDRDECDYRDAGGCERAQYCDHCGTDGTVDCPECGVTASEFITAAGDWLDAHDGATSDDPGYFAD